MSAKGRIFVIVGALFIGFEVAFAVLGAIMAGIALLNDLVVFMSIMALITPLAVIITTAILILVYKGYKEFHALDRASDKPTGDENASHH